MPRHSKHLSVDSQQRRLFFCCSESIGYLKLILIVGMSIMHLDKVISVVNLIVFKS